MPTVSNVPDEAGKHLRYLHDDPALTLGQATLTGNLDPVARIMRSTPQQIKRQFRYIYQQVGSPYMVNAGCEVPVGTPVENLKALCEPIPAGT